MAIIQMNYSLAMAAGQDAANRRMRKQCRKKWNQDDWNLMVDTFDRLFGKEALRLARERLAAEEGGR